MVAAISIRLEQCILVGVISAAIWYLVKDNETIRYLSGNGEEKAFSKITQSVQTISLSLNCSHHVIEISTDRKCAKRFHYLRIIDRHVCFGRYGVSQEADDCTLLRYLIYTERICPEHLGPIVMHNDEILNTKIDLVRSGKLTEAKPTLETKSILSKLLLCGEVCDWIRHRIEGTNTSWINATKSFLFDKLKTKLYGVRRKLTVLFHMGLLTKEFGLDFGRGAFAGGPLGELVQWADLVAALHFLGHEVVLSWSRERLMEVLIGNIRDSNYCKRSVVADIVYTDITGLEQMRRVLGTIHHYRCRLRVLDVFGTEPEFNHPRYQQNIKPAARKRWGGIGLNPKQFLTHFPHTPDNSFLGFTVQRSFGKAKVKSDRCLLYGKRSKYLKAISETRLLEILHRHFPDIHATMVENKPNGLMKTAPFVTNHGAMDQRSFIELLGSSKVYVGLGRPVEGPAPLEAIANGVIFLNPKFPLGFRAHEGKPTNRSLTSQHPYVETSIGEPYAFTVDLNNDQDIENVLEKIRFSEPNAPKVTHEFTHLGFLERVNAYIENQDFCEGARDYDPSSGVTWSKVISNWPPLSSLVTKWSKRGESCVEACIRHNMTCERDFFRFLNVERPFTENGIVCSTYEELGSSANVGYSRLINDICHAPSIDQKSGACLRQSDPLLFSCACVPDSHIQRLCPCREYKKEQTALCRHCE